MKLLRTKRKLIDMRKSFKRLRRKGENSLWKVRKVIKIYRGRVGGQRVSQMD